MLTWTEEAQPAPTLPVAQKNAPAYFGAEANMTDQLKHAPQHADASVRVDGAANPGDFPDPKIISTLQARFALAGCELRAMEKPGCRAYCEVRRLDECYTVSSEADVRGLLTRVGGGAT